MLYLLFILFNVSEIVEEISFYESEVFYKETAGYTIAGLKGCNFSNIPGEPCVPVKSFYFVLPPNSGVKTVRIILTEYKTLPVPVSIYPAQPPQVLSHIGPIQFVNPKQEIYGAKMEYPGKITEFKGEGNIHGERIAEILIYPIQWNPGTKQLKLYTRIKICIELSRLVGIASGGEEIGNIPFEAMNLVKSFVLNNTNYQVIKQPSKGYEYAIITSDSLVSAFEPLAYWKTTKGVPAIIRTTEWIDANYTGRDLAEKIRNYLKVISDSGVIWVLLGGDTQIIPSRTAYAMTCGAKWLEREDSIQADLYYSDLDGSWDANGNGTFGEIDDEVDLYPELFVGRAPVNNVVETQNFVNKTLKYEKNPPANYLTDALFFAMVLWQDPYTDAGIAKDIIGELFPQQFNIEKLYESLHTEDKNSVITAINSGKGLLNHDGHGYYNVMCVGEEGEQLYNEDIDSLKNGDAQGILYSIACLVGAIDSNCIAEHWIKAPNGGGVAMISNSRYGWGSPGNPGYGYSDKLDETFFSNLFTKNITNIGQTLAKTKMDYIAFSRSENVYRWHQYQVNLLGDPELDIWTAEPQTLTITCPDSIATGEQGIKIGVSNNIEPIYGAKICCLKNNEVYEVAYTNELGEASFIINPASTGNLTITASCHNYYPSQKMLKVFGTGGCVVYYKHSISDSGGNGEINPGEKIDLSIGLKNTGTREVYVVNGVLRTQNNYITILDSTGNFGNIPSADTSFSSFSFRTAESCTNNQYIQLELTGNFAPVYLNFQVKSPFLVYESCSSETNIPYPKDTVEIWTRIKNYGGIATNIIGKLRSLDSYITILDSIANMGNLAGGSSAIGFYIVQVASNCPVPHFAKLVLDLTTMGKVFQDTFLLEIGNEPIRDNFEAGLDGWTTDGVPNSWSLTSYGAYSGNYSLYCGNLVNWNYENSTNNWLKSPTFVLGPNTSLLFWTWYDISTMGLDGLYVEIGKGNEWTKLDFIGSGGELSGEPVLDSIPQSKDHFTIDWCPQIYDLSTFPVGCTLQVKFTFVSDEKDSAEGFYIDDVYIGHLYELPALLNRLWVDIRDSSANRIIEPGEKINCTIAMIAENSDFPCVSGVLKTRDSYITILNDSVYWGNIKQGDIIKGSYVFRIAPNASYGHKIKLALHLKDNQNYRHTSEFNIKVGEYIGVENQQPQYKDFILYQNTPNPFIGSTVISYQIPIENKVSLKIYDLTGRLVNTLVDEVQNAGFYQIKWNVNNKVSSGIYFYKLESGEYTAAKKMFLIK